MAKKPKKKDALTELLAAAAAYKVLSKLILELAIDEKTVALLSEIDTIGRDLKLAFFIFGATARVILLQHAYGIHTTTAMLDVDIGVAVSDWDQIRTLTESLAPLPGIYSDF